MSKYVLGILAAALLFGGCATVPTLYAAATGPQSPGFSEYRIEPGRYRITFRGGDGATINQVADFALLRAADLTLADGYDWFQVADRNTSQTGPRNGPQFSVGVGGGSFGGRGGLGVSLGKSFDLGGGPPLSQTLEIVMGKGPLPRDAYDAREVRHNLGPRA